jgi:hypothetical protein
MKAVISGRKKTVGGTVVATARGLKAFEPIQYSGMRVITSPMSTRTTATRFQRRCILDVTVAIPIAP